MRVIPESRLRVLYSSHSCRSTISSNRLSSEVDLENLIFVCCPDCQRVWMASVPQGAYAAWKVHRNMMKDLKEDSCSIMGKKNDSEKPLPHQFHFPKGNKKFLDPYLAKYNSKMMDSIWGLYNRYSVHNLKKITDGDDDLVPGVHQQIAVVTPKTIPSSTVSIGGPTKGPQALKTWETLLSGHTY